MARPSDEERAVRRFCLECQGGSAPAVKACSDAACLLFSVRMCTAPAPQDSQPPRQSPPQLLRLVRGYCMACAGTRREVRACDARSCPLWSYRFGVLPATFKRVVARRRLRKQILTLF